MTANNVDQNAVRHFSRQVGEWWNPDGVFRTLHDINDARLSYVRRFADLSTSAVLDVGCGGGILAEAMARLGARVTGLDASAENIASARRHAADSGLRVDYQLGAVDDFLQTAPPRFDALVCMELLEHVPAPGALVQSCAKLVRPGGLLCFSTLHRHPKAYLAAIVIAEHLLSLLPRGSHRYDQFIRPSELAAWCRAAGLQVQDICGLRYIPWLRKARLCAGVDVNYLLVATRPE